MKTEANNGKAMNLPNKLSILRILLVPVFVVFFYLPYDFSPFVALFVFLLAAFTDFLDGYIARKYNLVTDLGKLLDPIADKLLVCFALFAVVSTDVLYTQGFEYSRIFLAVGAALIIGRELLVSAVRQIAAAKGKVIQANIFGKIKTVFQFVALPLLIILEARSVFSATAEAIVWWCALMFFSISVVLTLVSGVIYLIQNRKVFLGD